jgi:hypothetical protein
MNRMSRTAGLLGLFALLALLVAGCESAKIADINRDPGRYAGKEVTISGRVTNSFGALNEGAFEIDDGTGKLWVLSGGFGVPSKGAEVSVTGNVQAGVTFGERSFGTVLRETRPRKGG